MLRPIPSSSQPAVRPGLAAWPSVGHGPQQQPRKPRLARYRPVPPVYVDDEGYPVSDNAMQTTSHASALVYLHSALTLWLGGRAQVFTDLGLYYRRGDRGALLVPDLMVARCRAGDLRSYKLWEGLPVPELAIEVLSETTVQNDMEDKKHTYRTLGVKEYWLFDATGRLMRPLLRGYAREGSRYKRLPVNAEGRLRSDILKLEFQTVPTGASNGPGAHELRLFDPKAGEFLRSHEEAVADYQQERAAREEAEAELRALRERLAAADPSERPAGDATA